jgi:phosphoribosylformylglycinamidine (FGAM) synthase-like enzyme
MGAACRALDFPVVSGNVSLYNETEGRAILPTPVIGAVGLIDDLDCIVTLPFKVAGESIVLIGDTAGHLGCSSYLRIIEGRGDGPPPPINLSAEKRNGDLVRSIIHSGLVTACHDISDGGIAVAVAEMAMPAAIGATLSVPDDAGMPSHAWLYGEDQARYLVTTKDASVVLSRAAADGVPAVQIGMTGGKAIIIDGAGSVALSDLTDAHEGWFPSFMTP